MMSPTLHCQHAWLQQPARHCLTGLRPRPALTASAARQRSPGRLPNRAMHKIDEPYGGGAAQRR